jgi:hypothetical protein
VAFGNLSSSFGEWAFGSDPHQTGAVGASDEAEAPIAIVFSRKLDRLIAFD